jgi:predicted nucleotidyltransferase
MTTHIDGTILGVVGRLAVAPVWEIDSMSFPPPTQADIQRVVDLVVEAVQPLRVVLFGSQARGDTRPESDIDLMVVMPDGVRRLDVAKQLYDLGVPRVEFVVTTPELYERRKASPGLVYRSIERDGHELYVA